MDDSTRHRSRKAATSRRVDHDAGLILVVEDDGDLREILRVILESDHWVTEFAADGRQALEQVTTRQPTMVLLDLNLPDLSGEDVAAGLRERGQNDVPIVVVSADMWAAERALQLGATEFLPKPFEVYDILTAVHDALENPRKSPLKTAALAARPA